MNLLIVINSLATGGAEKLVLDSIPELIKNNVSVTLVLLNGSETPFLKELEQKRLCTIIALSKGSVYNPLLVLKLWSIMKEYSLIHVHLFPSLYWVALAKRLSTKKKVLIFTEHSTSNKRIRNRIFRILDKFMYSTYNTIVCITPKIKQIFKPYLEIAEEKVTIINNGVPIHKFKNATEIQRNKISKHINNTHFLVVQVSSFRKEKDQPTVIKALKYLSKDVKLVLVGDGPLRENCEILVKKLSLENRVSFLGLRSDVAEILKTCNVCVLSSFYEGLSLSSIEGMASGNPFIASRVPGLEEMVENAGLLFEQGNARQLAAHIEKLKNDEEFAREVALKCQRKASGYSIEKMVSNYIDLYKSYG